jgi:D-psicose/D-tagatose/L-ribulose 3-epimerase
MRFGANTLIWAESFGPEQFSVLSRVKAAGLDGVEIPLFHPAGFAAGSIRRALQDAGLACTACTVMPGGMSLASADRQVRDRAGQHLRDCLSAAAELGAGLLVGPMYSPVGCFTGQRRTPDEWLRVVETWQRLADAVQASGVAVAIEPLNRFETYFLNTVADAALLCDEIGNPQIGILVDTFHANIEEKSVGAALRQAGRHLKHVHTCENDRGTPGTGNVNWPEFFAAIQAVRYDGWLTIESFGFRLGEIAAAASIWRDLAPTPESIAFEGVKFLRANVAKP